MKAAGLLQEGAKQYDTNQVGVEVGTIRSSTCRLAKMVLIEEIESDNLPQQTRPTVPTTPVERQQQKKAPETASKPKRPPEGSEKEQPQQTTVQSSKQADGLNDLQAMSDSEASRWRQAFEAVLHQILKEYEGQDAAVRNGMESGMRKLFEHPYHEELSGICDADKKEKLTVEEAQRVIFFPRLSDMHRYVAAFGLNTPTATARRQQLMKFKLMSVFYTLHRKDGSLMDGFMHCGGLASLAKLLGEDHVVIQSQAVELLLELLSPLMGLPSMTSSLRQAHLHHQVFVCFRSSDLWKNFAKIIAEPHELFPRSHAHSVKILLGAIGWFHPEPGEIAEVGLPDGMHDTVEALKRFLEAGVTTPEVRQLAEDLLRELQDSPTIRADPLRGKRLDDARKDIFSPAAVGREDAAHVWQSLRRLGNEAFGAGLIWPAEAAYRLALDDGGTAVPAEEASLIHSNLALVLLRAGQPSDAVVASTKALELNSRNAKAAYRQAQALLEQTQAASGQTAVDLVLRAVRAAESAAGLSPNDAKVAELLRKVRECKEEIGATTPSLQPNSADDMASLDAMD